MNEELSNLLFLTHTHTTTKPGHAPGHALIRSEKKRLNNTKPPPPNPNAFPIKQYTAEKRDDLQKFTHPRKEKKEKKVPETKTEISQIQSNHQFMSAYKKKSRYKLSPEKN